MLSKEKNTKKACKFSLLFFFHQLIHNDVFDQICFFVNKLLLSVRHTVASRPFTFPLLRCNYEVLNSKLLSNQHIIMRYGHHRRALAMRY